MRGDRGGGGGAGRVTVALWVTVSGTVTLPSTARGHVGSGGDGSRCASAMGDGESDCPRRAPIKATRPTANSAAIPPAIIAAAGDRRTRRPAPMRLRVRAILNGGGAGGVGRELGVSGRAVPDCVAMGERGCELAAGIESLIRLLGHRFVPARRRSARGQHAHCRSEGAGSTSGCRSPLPDSNWRTAVRPFRR